MWTAAQQARLTSREVMELTHTRPSGLKLVERKVIPQNKNLSQVRRWKEVSPRVEVCEVRRGTYFSGYR